MIEFLSLHENAVDASLEGRVIVDKDRQYALEQTNQGQIKRKVVKIQPSFRFADKPTGSVGASQPGGKRQPIHGVGVIVRTIDSATEKAPD